MINILRMINKEKNQIDLELATEDERLEFYREFFTKNGCHTLNDALKADSCDLAIALLLNMEPTLPVQQVKDVVYGNRDIFDNLDHNAIGELIKLVEGLMYDPETYKKVKTAIQKNGDTPFKNLFTKEGQIAIMIQHLAKSMDTTPQQFFAFAENFMEHSNAFAMTLSIVSVLREIKEDKSRHYEFIREITSDDSSKRKDKFQDKFVSDMIKCDYNIANLLQPITAARNEYYQLEQRNKNHKKSLARTKTQYEQLETNLYKAISEGEVRNIESLLKKIPSAEIRLAVLKLVYTHNQDIYRQLSAEYQVLAANDASHYQVLLAKYGISPETYEVGTVMDNSIEDLNLILDTLSKLKIASPQELLLIIQNTNLETITNLTGLAEKGIITRELLASHHNLFNPSSNEYENFMRNLDLITKKKLNPHYFTASEELLTVSHQKFQSGLKVLENYELLGNIKTGMNLSFLQEPNLEEGIDTLLELGFESSLEECLELLNYKDRFARLRVLKALNIPVSSTEELIEVLTTSKFYIPDNEIPNYIYNAARYHLPKNVVETPEVKKKTSDVTRLSQFSETTRTYSFNGVLISKNKVHRNLSNIQATGKPTDRLKYGVLKGSVLTDEEVLKIASALTPQKTTRVVKEKK